MHKWRLLSCSCIAYHMSSWIYMLKFRKPLNLKLNNYEKIFHIIAYNIVYWKNCFWIFFIIFFYESMSIFRHNDQSLHHLHFILQWYTFITLFLVTKSLCNQIHIHTNNKHMNLNKKAVSEALKFHGSIHWLWTVITDVYNDCEKWSRIYAMTVNRLLKTGTIKHDSWQIVGLIHPLSAVGLYNSKKNLVNNIYIHYHIYYMNKS